VGGDKARETYQALVFEENIRAHFNLKGGSDNMFFGFARIGGVGRDILDIYQYVLEEPTLFARKVFAGGKSWIFAHLLDGCDTNAEQISQVYLTQDVERSIFVCFSCHHKILGNWCNELLVNNIICQYIASEKTSNKEWTNNG
jgi:hypothetical protein